MRASPPHREPLAKAAECQLAPAPLTPVRIPRTPTPLTPAPLTPTRSPLTNVAFSPFSPRLTLTPTRSARGLTELSSSRLCTPDARGTRNGKGTPDGRDTPN